MVLIGQMFAVLSEYAEHLPCSAVVSVAARTSETNNSRESF
jgi:hypothetical protein